MGTFEFHDQRGHNLHICLLIYIYIHTHIFVFFIHVYVHIDITNFGLHV